MNIWHIFFSNIINFDFPKKKGEIFEELKEMGGGYRIQKTEYRIWNTAWPPKVRRTFMESPPDGGPGR